ncbi:MAG: ATP-binding protein [Candidatus Binataceae bacterium]
MPLDNLFGHQRIYERMLAEIQSRPAHAYLFAGPRGIGKSLIAQALTHSLLCERTPGAQFCCAPDRCPVRAGAGVTENSRRGNQDEPARCGCCAACVQVAAGVHPDFIGISRPAGRADVSIDQVRGLIARLGTKASRGPMRAAIIDDGETLNLPAQNALLKTLEEPPGFTIIFLIAHSERALLDTVRSRLRSVRFPALAVSGIAAILEARLGTAHGQALALAALARGSAARALDLTHENAPPMGELISAFARAGSFDFPAVAALAQEFFAVRDQALGNFELIARMLEEVLCFKLIGAEIAAPSTEALKTMRELAERLETAMIVDALDGAVKAASAVEAMANPRLQAENWWMKAARTIQGEQ